MQTSLEIELGGERVDFYNLIAIERGCPEGWRWFDLQVLGDHKSPRAQTSFRIRGAVCTAVYERGSRKGETNWMKRDRDTEREFVVSFTELDARIAQWQLDTGKCATCFGTGFQRVGSAEHRTCEPCKGTGKPAAP